MQPERFKNYVLGQTLPGWSNVIDLLYGDFDMVVIAYFVILRYYFENISTHFIKTHPIPAFPTELSQLLTYLED